MPQQNLSRAQGGQPLTMCAYRWGVRFGDPRWPQGNNASQRSASPWRLSIEGSQGPVGQGTGPEGGGSDGVRVWFGARRAMKNS
jgi:hypothetical protein